MADEQPHAWTRIEEAQMFTERAVEELDEQVLDLHRKLEQLAARVTILENQLRAHTEPSGPEPDQMAP